MRELKFRIWNHTEGRWNGMWCKDVQSCGELICLNGIYVIPESISRNHTVQQYTGFKDKNGVDIYEGDIFKGGQNKWDSVKFENGKFIVNLMGARVFDLEELFEDRRKPEIVGNIFENPELKSMKYLGKIKNRYDSDRIEMPEDIWTNPNYRIRLDKTGEWSEITKCYDLAMASIIELGVIENIEV